MRGRTTSMPGYELAPYARLLIYRREYTWDFVRRTIEEDSLLGLRIFAHAADQQLDSLDFLRDYTFLRRLDITALTDGDFGYEFLLELVNLESLSLCVTRLPPRQTNLVDVGRLVRIEKLTLESCPRLVGLDRCERLIDLALVQLKASNLALLRDLGGLETLMVKISNLRSLDGVERLRRLKHATFANLSRLEDIEALRKLPELRVLRLERCPKLTDLDALAGLPSLEKLEIVDCKRISSIRPLLSLSALRELSLTGTTDVLDGDLTPAQGIPSVFYRHRSHYNVQIENREADRIRAQNLAKLRKLRGGSE